MIKSPPRASFLKIIEIHRNHSLLSERLLIPVPGCCIYIPFTICMYREFHDLEVVIYMAVKVINLNSVPLVLQSIILENIMCYATNYSQRLTTLKRVCDFQKKFLT